MLNTRYMFLMAILFFPFLPPSLSSYLSSSLFPFPLFLSVHPGVLKDYLRELPYPLITKHLYEAVLDSIAKRPLRIGPGGCENDQGDTEHTVSLLEIGRASCRERV